MPTPYRAPASSTSLDYPLVLNTGRIRDQWHTMTRTGKAARLLTHLAEPILAIHPEDAVRFGVRAGELCTVTSLHGAARLRVDITAHQPQGSVFAPIHWTDQFASSARIDAVVRADVDPISGQPGLKYTPVSVAPYKAAWFALINCRTKPAVNSADHWVLAATEGGWRAELAGQTMLDDPAQAARAWLGITDDADIVEVFDPTQGRTSIAVFDGDRLIASAFVSRTPLATSRSFTSEQLGAKFVAAAERMQAAAGRPGAGRPDRGAIVCSCFGVGQNEIAAVIAAGNCTTVDSIGKALKAGTNCGSCKPELSRLIAEWRAVAAE